MAYVSKINEYNVKDKEARNNIDTLFQNLALTNDKIDNEISSVNEKIDNIDIAETNANVNTLSENVSTLTDNVNKITEDIESIETIETNISNLTNDTTDLKNRATTLENKKLSFKEVIGTFPESGGGNVTLTNETNLVGEFVNFEFASTNNTYHRTSNEVLLTNFTNYFLVQYEQTIYYIVVNNISNTGFDISILNANGESTSNLRLAKISKLSFE